MLILFILKILFIVKVIGYDDVQPIVVPSLVHEFVLPKNPLVNPFYNPQIDALSTFDTVLAIKGRLTGRSIEIDDTDISNLEQRSTIDSAWENLIVSGPITVNLLAQVMVLSSKRDFSFRDAVPGNIFQYVKYPDSFRMTLNQISNEGWRAFLTAHINMDKLQLNMQRIPTHIKIALSILSTTTTQTSKQIETQMSKILQTVLRIGNDCISVANDTHIAFSTVMNYLGEVIALTETSKSLRETRLRETEIELNVSRVWQKQLKQLRNILKEHYESTVEDLRFAHIEYSRALARRSSRFEKGLMRLTSAVVKLTRNAAKVLERLTSDEQQINGASSALNYLLNGSVMATADNGKALLIAQSLSESMNDLFSIFNDIFYSINNQTTSHNPKEMENILCEIETYEKLIGKTDIVINVVNPILEQIKNVTIKAIELAQDNALGKSVNRTETDYVSAQLKKLIGEMKKIDAAAGLIDDPSGMKPSEDNQFSSDSAKMAIQITEQKLEDARKRSDASLAQLRKNMNDMNELVGKIASLDLTRISYAELLDYMRQALRLLATMRQTWAQLVLFFSTIASQAEIALSGTLDPFIQQAKRAGNEDISADERSFFVELLKEQSISIYQTSYSLFIMSRTYVDMSNEFLMPRLSGLSLMFTAKDDNERMVLNNRLALETKATQTKVKALVEERKMTYTSMVNNQLRKLQTTLQNLGGPSIENQRAIDEASELLSSQ
ncbi:unnamed protein product [Adineta ricciae]|uniref:Uncharacterized protein n=1 Tax=Adineta ricciae TaxID=249248 RepID=A0A815MLZ0_ADIRI|nr:unnamed protein product [Adineta ricciae]